MNAETLHNILSIGETVSVEFKRGGNGAEADTFESICAFLNRFGGDVFLGVLDNGTVVGVPPAAAPQIANHIVNIAGDPGVFQPAVYLAPEIIQWEGRTIVHVHVPNSGEVHSYKRVVYDRAGDADVKVKATGQIAMMYIRKQNFYTEQRIYPFVGKEDLRLDLLPVVRQMAQNCRKEGHPWYKLADDALLKSAGLVGLDRDSGKRGFNLAAILLLGRDETIRDICPAYMTDALWRVRNLDRYDDREVVRTNLIESYERLMEFGRKHLPDPFFLEGSVRISLREILTREMVANVLIHREFVSPKPARFVIERDRMFTENACRSARSGAISPENIEPEAKNPIIAAFFREIGLADQLGSGVRNLYKYARAYGGEEPEIVENDIFRISVNIPQEQDKKLLSRTEAYHEVAEKTPLSLQDNSEVADPPSISPTDEDVIKRLKDSVPFSNLRKDAQGNLVLVLKSLITEANATVETIARSVSLSVRTVNGAISILTKAGIIRRVGPDKGGHWEVVESEHPQGNMNP